MGHPNDVRTLDACTGIRLNNRVILSTKRWMAYGHLPLCKQTSWNAAKHLLLAHTHNTFTIRFTMFIRDRFFPGYYGPLKYCECASNRGFFFRFVRVGVAQLFDSHWFRIHLYTHPTTTNHWNRGAAASVHVFFSQYKFIAIAIARVYWPHQTASGKWIIVKIIVTTLVTVRSAIVRLHNEYSRR